MSSTKRGYPRHRSDSYNTPAWAAETLLDDYERFVTTIPPLAILDPGCGIGNLSVACHERWPDADLVGFEIENDAFNECHTRLPDMFVNLDDYLEHTDLPDVQLVICNPPFSIAQEFIQHTRDIYGYDTAIAFLLRLNFLGSKKRLEALWTPMDQKPKIKILIPRPSFFKGPNSNTDSIEYCWMVWNWGGPAISWLTKPEGKK